MTADLIPIRLTVTAGDRYTLWAPQWRDSGDEWEAFLGKGDDLYGFETVADLVAFVRTDTGNDLADHPRWKGLTEANAHRLNPSDKNEFDLIAVEELVSDKPTKKSVAALADTLSVVASIGSVCDLPAVTKFFNGNPSLGVLAGGVGNFAGRAGRKRWNSIGEIIGHNWDNVLAAVEGIITTPEVSGAASSRAAQELTAEPPEVAIEPTDTDAADDAEATEATDEKPTAAAAEVVDGHHGHGAGHHVVLGTDKDFWHKVGIDPIRIMTGAGTFYSLRCYLDDRPIFLGRNGRISVFGSERTLARYLADEHDHDLSDLSTYDDIRTAATDGSLAINVTAENVYMLTGLADDFADGPAAVDRDQLDLAVELLRDVGQYAEDDIVAETLADDHPLGKLVDYVLDPEAAERPEAPLAAAVKEWEDLERFVESRLRRE